MSRPLPLDGVTVVDLGQIYNGPYCSFLLAMAGALAAKKRATATDGTLPTHGPLFVVLLGGVVLLVGLLNYVPALALGPVVEHLMLWPR